MSRFYAELRSVPKGPVKEDLEQPEYIKSGSVMPGCTHCGIQKRCNNQINRFTKSQDTSNLAQAAEA